MTELIIDAIVSGYSTDQIINTMTVEELRNFLKDFDNETKIFLSFNDGYSFGGLGKNNFDEIEVVG